MDYDFHLLSKYKEKYNKNLLVSFFFLYWKKIQCFFVGILPQSDLQSPNNFTQIYYKKNHHIFLHRVIKKLAGNILWVKSTSYAPLSLPLCCSCYIIVSYGVSVRFRHRVRLIFKIFRDKINAFARSKMLHFGCVQTRQVILLVNAPGRVKNLKMVTWEKTLFY